MTQKKTMLKILIKHIFPLISNCGFPVKLKYSASTINAKNFFLELMNFDKAKAKKTKAFSNPGNKNKLVTKIKNSYIPVFQNIYYKYILLFCIFPR